MSILSQRNLAGGELAPALYARVDTIKYQTGVRKARNVTIIRSGGMQNRPGTRFIGEAKQTGHSTSPRLIPFVFNADQTYMLEFGNLYMRVIRNGAYVLGATKNITGATQASQVVITSTAHGYANGQEIYISDIVGMAELNGQNYLVSDVTANTYKLKYLDGTYVNSTGFTAYTSGGTSAVIYEIATPYSIGELMDIQFAQSGDIITIVHPNYFPYDLSRLDHDDWTLAPKNLEPVIGIPGSVSFTDGTGTPVIYSYQYRVCAVSSDNFEEGFSGDSGTFAGINEPTSSQVHTVTWSAVTGAAYYNVYVVRSGNVGFVGSSTTTTFINYGITPDFTKTPPVVDTYFTFAEDQIRPACVNYAQQRLIFGNNNYVAGTLQPEEIRTSRTGLYNNFSTSIPRQDSDAIRFRMAGRQVNEIRHILDLNRLVIMTSGGEFTIEGGNGGVLTPSDINVRQYSYHGSSKRPPIVIDSNAIFVQARGSIVRDFGFDYTVDGYKGNDLTVFSTHLFDGFEIIDWAYQKTPNSVVWAVRDDGKLLSLTYIREHQIWGWTQHDTDGFVERVSVIPEGIEDTLYMVVRRTVNGREVKYVEAMASRFIDDVKDMVFMDSSLTYDGRNTDTGHTLKITNLGGSWLALENVAVESSVAMFTASSVGQKLQITSADGTSYVVCEIVSIFDSQNAVVSPDRDVDSPLRAINTTNWVRAVRTIKGLRHLEGKNVSLLCDGDVVGSPNNPDNVVVTVANGQITLDDAYGVIHIGLPYISDIETLSIDSANSETLVNKKILINQVWLQVEKTRGMWAGTLPVADDAATAIDGLIEFKLRDDENYDDPVALKTGIMDVATESNFNDNGRVFLRQIDPLPMTVLGIHPAGDIPIR